MSRTGAVLLKALALGVGITFLAGAVLTSAPPLVTGAAPKDGGTYFNATKSAPLPEPQPPVAADASTPEPAYFPATKSAVLPRPRPKPADAGAPPLGSPTYFPASKSFGGGDLRGPTQGFGTIGEVKKPTPAQTPQQQAP